MFQSVTHNDVITCLIDILFRAMLYSFHWKHYINSIFYNLSKLSLNFFTELNAP